MRRSSTNICEISFPAMSENEAFARMAVAAFVAPLNPTLEEISDIKTAVSEAVTNAIIHGYENSVGMVRLEGKIYIAILPKEFSEQRRHRALYSLVSFVKPSLNSSLEQIDN